MASSFVVVVLLRILDTASEEAKLYLLEYFSNVVFSSVNGYPPILSLSPSPVSRG